MSRLASLPRLAVLFTAFALAGATQPVRADITLWYNGDAQGSPRANEESTLLGSINVYDDFQVTDPGGWDVHTVWSNNDVINSLSVTQASWAIRTGVSDGNPGTIVASGIDAATQTSTGRQPLGSDQPESTIAVDGLNVHLAPGTYWLSVSPLVGDDPGGFLRSYLSPTIGTNAVGSPPGNDGNSFFNGLGSSFAALGNDYSMGVAGTVGVTAVPEPSSLNLMAAASLSAAGYLGVCRLRRRRHVGRASTLE